MFKFSFFNSQNNTGNKEDLNEDVQEESWLASEELYLNNSLHLKEVLNNKEVNVFKCEDTSDVLYLSPNTVIDSIRQNHIDNSLVNAEINHSDLIPSVYEGGLKIWECTYDLMKYLASLNLNLDGKMILDLGCGAGIIGIYCLLRKSIVYFQDYNREVVQYITIPNVILNMKSDFEDVRLNNCKFYCGDWKSFLQLIDVKFDYIFTSETIYNTRNYEKLHELFKKCLNRNGVIYLASKTYYFGVGGGLRSFEDYIEQEGVFNSTICWKTDSGLQREILTLLFKDNK